MTIEQFRIAFHYMLRYRAWEAGYYKMVGSDAQYMPLTTLYNDAMDVWNGKKVNKRCTEMFDILVKELKPFDTGIPHSADSYRYCYENLKKEFIL